jgi:hypothetical protein
LRAAVRLLSSLRAKPGADAVPVIVGDMTTTGVDGSFALVYLVANSIMNVTTQDEQLAVFGNAAAHPGPGGRFVVSVIVPRPPEVYRYVWPSELDLMARLAGLTFMKAAGPTGTSPRSPRTAPGTSRCTRSAVPWRLP